MDAPGAKTVSEGAIKNTSERDASTARSRSPSDTAQNGHKQHHQSGESSDDDSEGSEQIVEEEDEAGSEEEEDDEPRLKYAYLTKHLGSIYRNGDATSTFLVAGDKMVYLSFWASHTQPSVLG